MLFAKGTKFFQPLQLLIIFFLTRNNSDVFFRRAIEKAGKESITVSFCFFLLSFKRPVVYSNGKAVLLQNFILDLCEVGAKD